MRLPKPFYRLPVRFDAERLRAEVTAMPATAWVSHPNDYAGNTSLRLISVNGATEGTCNVLLGGGGQVGPPCHPPASPAVTRGIEGEGPPPPFNDSDKALACPLG